MDELIDGTVQGWPCSIRLMRNPGEKWVGVHAAPYTGENDMSPPPNVAAQISELEGDFNTKREAMNHVRRLGFAETN